MISTDPMLRSLAARNWPLPTEGELHAARQAVDQCLRDREEASIALARFYDPASSYAGRTFLDLQPSVVDAVTAADLLAVTLLDVAVRPSSVRCLLNPGPKRDRVLAALRDSSAECDLAAADAADLEAAAELYRAVKDALGRNPWVIASKLCARKRPALIPVRDNVVVDLLHLRNRDFRSDWLVYRHLLRDEALMAELRKAATTATEQHAGPDLADLSSLRLLDSLLWMMRPSEPADAESGRA